MKNKPCAPVWYTWPALFALLLSALSAPFASAEAATEDHPGHLIPSQICRGLWIIPITFDEDPNRTLRLILDTGANVTSVDPDAIERVVGRRIRVGKKIRLKNGDAGPLKINSIKVVSHEMDTLARALGTHVDGILGFRTFDDLLLTLDYVNSEVRVAEGELPEVDGQVVFRDFGKSRPFMALDIGGTRVAVLVDSGATGGLTLRESDVLEWKIPPRVTSGSVRYKVIETDREGRMKGLVEIGPLTFEQPIVEVKKSGTRLAGWKIMRGSVWTFDQRNNRIRVAADSNETVQTEPVTGIGLIFRPGPDGLEVMRALEDMPAKRAGVLKGDIITAIEGIPIYERGCKSIDENGANVVSAFSLRRGDESHEIRIQRDVLVP